MISQVLFQTKIVRLVIVVILAAIILAYFRVLRDAAHDDQSD